ncbi:disulfide bond formation protein DsbA [Pokkaliibacter plantistimulans]|uniref:Disulfide bond formation protein DsbA n=1 Tax=Proteobacteria bacterium 228 TaxID=2083153 RepID=A0A2S5KGK3_9PROT|nr:DsbA family protein [Pokkaliibacter plantistimulans]PPC73931.1 disulfide bond formation protein DsbA [Pokkaliibacter plantistimulans]
MSELRLLYFFDPLCGWCYASAPALAALAEHYPQQLQLMPSGLFSGQGARPMSRDFADYAWQNDQRIEKMTGQRFTEAYLQQVLHGKDVRFDSSYASLAMTAAAAMAPALEAQLLHALQLARYVEGVDTSKAEHVAAICQQVAETQGISLSRQEWLEKLQDSTVVAQRDARIGQAQQFMQQLGIQGVPQLVVNKGDQYGVISGGALYQDKEALLEMIASAFRA